jgi:hypothetical protein
MSCTRRLLLGLAVAAVILPCRAADDKKEEKKKEPPRITGVVPFAVVSSVTNKITIRGLNLTNATGIRFPSASNNFSVEIKSRGKATVPDKGDPKKLGDTQLEIGLVLPQDYPSGDLPFVVETAEGDTTTNLLFAVAKNLLLDEQEPNGGFRKPNNITMPQTLRGVIQEPNDVDVFRLEAKAGQKLRIESLSTRYGSPLDPIVTLYDALGHTLASSDDASDSRDALIRFVVPSDGAYFVSIIDAHDRGGASYVYALVVSEE